MILNEGPGGDIRDVHPLDFSKPEGGSYGFNPNALAQDAMSKRMNAHLLVRDMIIDSSLLNDGEFEVVDKGGRLVVIAPQEHRNTITRLVSQLLNLEEMGPYRWQNSYMFFESRFEMMYQGPPKGRRAINGVLSKLSEFGCRGQISAITDGREVFILTDGIYLEDTKEIVYDNRKIIETLIRIGGFTAMKVMARSAIRN